MSRPIRTPGPDHPITIEGATRPVRAYCGARMIAQSARALVLREAGYQPVVYFPREDVDMSALARSATSSWCPYKGEASYFSLSASDGAAVPDIAWSYETPAPAMAPIAGRIAFYASKARIEEG